MFCGLSVGLGRARAITGPESALLYGAILEKSHGKDGNPMVDRAVATTKLAADVIAGREANYRFDVPLHHRAPALSGLKVRAE